MPSSSESLPPSSGKPRAIRVGLSLMPSEDFRRATEISFAEGDVDALEWNVDMGWGPPGTPAWVEQRLDEFAERGRLYAHGVELSPLSARLLPHQEMWLDELARAFERRRFVHLTDHFGFMTAGTFLRGTPLPLPQSEAVFRVAKERISRLRAIAGCPVGLENLALAFGDLDVRTQPAFLRRTLDETDGFLLLDLHNVHCQLTNFGGDPKTLLARYPLDRVREIHVAGGSWSRPLSDPEGRPFRRDSHDDDMPVDVLGLLELVIPACPALEVVILERTDRSLYGDDEARRFRAELRRLRETVARLASRPIERWTTNDAGGASDEWIDDDTEALDRLQRCVLETFAGESNPVAALETLRALDDAKPYEAWTASFEPRAVEVGISLVRQWGTRVPEEGTMLAAVLPAPRATFELRHVPIPRPGPGQALLRIRASGICGTDLHIHQGRMAMPLPSILGHEPVGEVEEVGEGVTSIRVGDRVGVPWVQAGCGECDACARGKMQHCVEPRTWVQTGGGHAEHMLVDARGCVAIPEGLSFEEAAPMFCAGFTVMSGYRRAAARSGERVAVLGIGGLGHLAVQIAKCHGHEVVAITSTESKREDIRRLGADEVLLGAGDPGRALAEAGGADIILATSSSAADVGSMVSGLRPEGRLVVMGLGDGALSIDPMALILAQGSLVGAGQNERRDLVDVLGLAAEGRIRAAVEAFPLVLVERAMARLAEGRARHRAVLTL